MSENEFLFWLIVLIVFGALFFEGATWLVETVKRTRGRTSGRVVEGVIWVAAIVGVVVAARALQ